jgi:hypothetical protein
MTSREFYDLAAKPRYAIILAAMLFGRTRIKTSPAVLPSFNSRMLSFVNIDSRNVKRNWNGVGFASIAMARTFISSGDHWRTDIWWPVLPADFPIS